MNLNICLSVLISKGVLPISAKTFIQLTFLFSISPKFFVKSQDRILVKCSRANYINVEIINVGWVELFSSVISFSNVLTRC